MLLAHPTGLVYPCFVTDPQEIVFYHRYERELCVESVYGGKALRWAYGSLTGRFFLESIIKHRWFSALYGKWADTSASAREISGFIKRFEIDPSEFLESPESYHSFNEFFSRRLRPESRPLSTGENDVLFPADGRHLLIQNLSASTPIYAKGRTLPLEKLLGSHELANHLLGGSAVISRLCPTDYHRFHFPLSGVCGPPRLINGYLYSVSPIALRRSLHYLLENKRRVTEIVNSDIGTYLFVEIGATNVGAIVDTITPGTQVTAGEEKGYFRFGGSMVMTLFPRGSFRADDDFCKQSEDGVELYAKMGDRMGILLRPTSSH